MADNDDKSTPKPPALFGSRFTFDFTAENASTVRNNLQRELDQIDHRISQHIDANTHHGIPVLHMVLNYVSSGPALLKLAKSLTAVAKLKARQQKLRDKLTTIDVITREPEFLADAYSAFDVPDNFEEFETAVCETEALVEDEMRSQEK